MTDWGLITRPLHFLQLNHGRRDRSCANTKQQMRQKSKRVGERLFYFSFLIIYVINTFDSNFHNVKNINNVYHLEKIFSGHVINYLLNNVVDVHLIKDNVFSFRFVNLQI